MGIRGISVGMQGIWVKMRKMRQIRVTIQGMKMQSKYDINSRGNDKFKK